MSSRPQRQTKPTQKVIEAQEAAKPAAPRQPRKSKNPVPQAQQPQQAPAAPVSNHEPIMAPIIADMEGFRDLNLDLSKVPKNKDDINGATYDSYQHVFWEKFYTPTDQITTRYMKATEILDDILPATFPLVEDRPESFGVANLELKREYVKPIAEIPLFSKLEHGDYQTEQTKSDQNIAASIKFFRNRFPSFQRYKDDDDISWVVQNHRLLVVEMFEYYGRDIKFAREREAAGDTKKMILKNQQ